MTFPHITILGLGLIGGSLAAAIKDKALARTVSGYDADTAASTHCLKQGWVDRIAASPAEAVAGADLVVLAAPPNVIPMLAREIAPHLAPGAVVTDTASVKAPIMQALKEILPPHVVFVPAHPIAGSAQSGPYSASPRLFVQRRVILTPTAVDDAFTRVRAFWESTGALVEEMTPAQHDRIYAYVSHLPHLLAYGCVAALAGREVADKDEEYFRRFLRIGGSNPALWADIFLSNRDFLLEALDRYIPLVSVITQELSLGVNHAEAKETPGAYHVLFPRIAASALVTELSFLEEQEGLALARYAGPGFADFACPAIRPPEEDIEHISEHYAQLAGLMDLYVRRLMELRALVLEGNAWHLQGRLERIVQEHRWLME